jgi:hypothetical protein
MWTDAAAAEPLVRWVAPGGRAALAAREPDIEPAECRTLIRDRRGTHRCLRRGWFALRDVGGEPIGPLCATHLQRLIRDGGPVLR